jgi:membrane-bound lytic murein transglycosylase D
LERRVAVSALAGAMLCALGLVFPGGAPAGDAPPAATADEGKAPLAEIRPGEPVPPVPSPSPADNALAREPASPGDSAAGTMSRTPPVPASVPSGLPVEPPVFLIAPPSEKAPDRVLAPGEVDLQVNRNLGEDAGGEGTIPDDFFANASAEVEKGKEGMFAGLANPIDKFIRYFQTRGRDRFELYLSRSGKYTGMMRGILAKYELPEDLVYLALIESGFSPNAYSVAKAAGPWQFIAATGRRYGLRIDWWADERRDAEKSTHAAASYLKDLYGMFESWPLAAAAYNAGEGKIIRAVNRYKSDDYAELIRHRYLKQETKDYVPKMLAALAIAKEPEKYGFGDVRYEAPLDLRTVEVPGGTDLAVVSEILEVPYGTLREWNPELRRFCTPPNRERYELRLSGDAALLAGERIEEIRTQAKITFLQHNVRKGETLQGLAEKYGTSAAALKELNGLKRDSLSRTSRLVIPMTGLSDEEAVPGKEISPDKLTMAHMRVEEGKRKGKGKRIRGPEPGESVRVRKGDTLGRLAKAHGVSAKELARANDLPPGAKLTAGSLLLLPGGEVSPSPAAAKKGSATADAPGGGKRTARYKVHKGDTLERIARVYGVTPQRLAERNRLKPGDPLRQGTVLVIPLES